MQGGNKGTAVVELLLQVYPEAVRIRGFNSWTPLDHALKRVAKQLDGTTQLSASDPLIKLLKAGG